MAEKFYLQLLETITSTPLRCTTLQASGNRWKFFNVFFLIIVLLQAHQLASKHLDSTEVSKMYIGQAQELEEQGRFKDTIFDQNFKLVFFGAIRPLRNEQLTQVVENKNSE